MKLKTHKATAKKIRVTQGKKGSKLITRRAGQDHFNARETGRVGQAKRRTRAVDTTLATTVRRQLPYS